MSRWIKKMTHRGEGEGGTEEGETTRGAEPLAPAAAPPPPPEEEHFSKREFIGGLWDKGLEKSKDELLKGKIALEKSLGLGHRPNAIPPGDPGVHEQHRHVEIGWHPVMGLSGKWFAEKTGLGRTITEKIHKYPDPTQHWAVLVGDYCHELWMDEHLDVIYINEKIKREEWRTFEVGKTRFNDEALRQTGEAVIAHMRDKKPAYNIVSNNCQNFAVLLLDAIQAGAHKEFGTTSAIYERMTGKGKIKDLFDEDPAQQQIDQQEQQQQTQSPVQLAQQVMDQNTTQLDNHHSLSHEC